MDRNNLKISKIETYLNSIIDNVVSNNTFFTALPDASIVKSSDWNKHCGEVLFNNSTI